MGKLDGLEPARVFYFFEQISAIPRGSGNTDAISEYCAEFAKKNALEYIKDDVGNIVILKPGSRGYETSEPIILQGHLDMVCQKTAESRVDFSTDGIDLLVDGDFIRARETTLGADNGIAVAMILAVLENDGLSHPPIEAVFTVDEEIGMLGAMKLDMSGLKSRRMINLDSEEEGVVTVSCAGGKDFTAFLPIERESKPGTKVTLSVSGLKGGHSGTEITAGRVNAILLLGRILDAVSKDFDFEIITLCGGGKTNAIPQTATAELCVGDADSFCRAAQKCFADLKAEIAHREESAVFAAEPGEYAKYDVLKKQVSKKPVSALLCVPNGVVNMSLEINGLAETSLNLGILNTDNGFVKLCFSLRSCKKTALDFLSRRLEVILGGLGFSCEVSGCYPPWEYRENSPLRDLFCDVYGKQCKRKPRIEAIHAGLECGVFSSRPGGVDCISIGPDMFDVHTVGERLSVSSVRRVFAVLTELLEKLK